jgi:putative copper export protein
MSLLRFSGFAANGILFGLPVFALWVLRPPVTGEGGVSPHNRRFGERLEDLVRACLIASFVAVSLTLLLQTALVAELRDADPGGDALSSVLSSRFGTWAAVRLPLLIGLGVLLVGRLRASLEEGSSRSWWVSWIALATGLLVATSLGGHASVAEPPLSVVNDVIHLASGAAWFAGIVGLVIILPSAGETVTNSAVALTVSRFAALALVAIGLALVTGTINSFLGLEGFADLLGTGYGRVLLAKIVVFCGILALGAFNHFKVRIRLERAARDETLDFESTRRVFRRAVAVELLIGLSLLVATALLTGLDPTRT